jgi:anhydro-N-acetylmuramic acid kinase
MSDATILATAVRLAAAAAHASYAGFAAPRCPVQEVLVSGQGAHNVALLEDLAELFEGAKVVTSDYYGLDVDAKEAATVAVLGHLSLDGEPATPSEVTGAACPVVAGNLTPGERPGA